MKSLWSCAAALFLVLAALPVDAEEDGLTYIVLAEDPAGDQTQAHGKFYDIRELAVAEPGDDTILFRVTVEDATDYFKVGSGLGSLRVDFKVNEVTSYIVQIQPTGTSTDDDHAESCTAAGNTFVCIVKYSKIAAKVGDKITSVKIASKLAQDPDTADGQDYTLTGSTVVETGPAVEAPIVLTEATIGVTQSASEPYTVTKTYLWTNPHDAVMVNYTIEVQGGSVAVGVAMNGTVLFSDTYAANDTGSLPLDPAPKAEWNITLTYTDFVGSFSLDVEPLAATTLPGGVDGTGTPNTTDGVDLEDDETEDSPGLALLPALGVLFGLAYLRRRRSA